MEKNYCVKYNVGRIKYVLNYHNGKDKYSDGSPFYDVALFRNKSALSEKIRELENDGYVERNN